MPNLLQAPSTPFRAPGTLPQSPLPTAQKPTTNQFGALTSLMPAASSSPLAQGSLNLTNGTRAANPSQNVAAPSNTLTKSQTAAVQPIPSTPQNNVTGGTPSSTPVGGLNYGGGVNAQGQGLGSIIPGANAAPTAGNLTTTNTQTPPAPAAPAAAAPAAAASPTQTGAITNLLTQYGTQGNPTAQSLINQAGQYAAGNVQLGADAQGVGNQYNQMAQSAFAAAAPEIASFSTGGGGPIGLGRAGAVQNTLSNYLQGLQSAENLGLNPLNSAITAQGQAGTTATNAANASNTTQQTQQSALNQAGGLATTYVNSPYGQPQYNPSTGTSISGGQPTGAGGGNFNPQSVATQLAGLVNSGQMTSDQAIQQMTSLYGSAGSTFLQQAMTGTPGGAAGTGGVNPSFNYVQSQQNQASQGQLGPQSTQAAQDFTNLQNTIANAPWYQQAGIPLINSVGGLLSSMGLLGSGAQGSQQQINSAISTTRAAVETALSTQYGGTPSDYSTQATAMFPPNITPAQISAGIQQFQTQMGIRQQAYGSPGTTPITTSVSNTSNQGGGWGSLTPAQASSLGD